MTTRTENSQTAYETWHEQLEVDAETNSPWHTALKLRIDPIRDLANRRVLEIGCGRGGFACWLAQSVHRTQEVVAVDFAATAVGKGAEFATQQGITGITWRTGDIQAIDYPDNSFDTVVSCETVEHVPDPAKAISELIRVLKPAGRLFLTTPNYLNLLGLYRGYLRMVGRRYTEEGQPINNFTLLPLTQRWVVRAGGSLIAADSDGYYLPFPGRPPIEIKALSHVRFLMRWLGVHSVIVAEKSSR